MQFYNLKVTQIEKISIFQKYKGKLLPNHDNRNNYISGDIIYKVIK